MISIITPCLNICKNGRKDYFDKMMQSVHNQSYNNLEHIIIDGNSEDKTLKILEQYKTKEWINHLVYEKDTGIYQAINKGIKLSTGDYILIMNTDDYFLDKNYFKQCINILKNNKFDFTHADRIIKSKENKPDFIKRGDERVAFFRMPFRHQTMIVKKEVFDDIGLFDEKYKIASDYKFVLKMLLAGKKGYHINQIILCSLDGGISSNRKKCIKEVSQVLYECYGRKYNLNLKECKDIYLRNISSRLYSKILFNIKNKRIKDSLSYCYHQQNQTI